VFTDAVDGLIEDGWKVVSAAEKRKAGAAGLDDDSDPLSPKFLLRNDSRGLDSGIRFLIRDLCCSNQYNLS